MSFDPQTAGDGLQRPSPAGNDDDDDDSHRPGPLLADIGRGAGTFWTSDSLCSPLPLSPDLPGPSWPSDPLGGSPSPRSLELPIAHPVGPRVREHERDDCEPLQTHVAVDPTFDPFVHGARLASTDPDSNLQHAAQRGALVAAPMSTIGLQANSLDLLPRVPSSLDTPLPVLDAVAAATTPTPTPTITTAAAERPSPRLLLSRRAAVSVPDGTADDPWDQSISVARSGTLAAASDDLADFLEWRASPEFAVPSADSPVACDQHGAEVAPLRDGKAQRQTRLVAYLLRTAPDAFACTCQRSDASARSAADALDRVVLRVSVARQRLRSLVEALAQLQKRDDVPQHIRQLGAPSFDSAFRYFATVFFRDPGLCKGGHLPGTPRGVLQWELRVFRAHLAISE